MAIKLFFFDLEGTLVVPQNVERVDGHGTSLWSRIFHELGPAALAEDDVGLAMWERGEHTYIEWCQYSVTLFKKYGLTRTMLEKLIVSTSLSPGANEIIASLHKQGIRTAIISGGLVNQASRVQRELGITHSYAATELFFAEDGTLEHWNILPSDNEAKVDFVELLRRECKLTKEECAFVGDGKNDVYIASHVGLSFAFNAHPQLQAVATHSITDLRDIRKHMPSQ